MDTKKEHHHHHNHSHAHSHNHGITAPNNVFKIGITLNLGFALVELYYGFFIQSLSLVSDAIHNLTDVLGLLVAWLGYYLSKQSKSKKYSLYAAFFNSAFLILSSTLIIKEAILRLQNPAPQMAKTMILVSGIGFFVNFISAKLFHKDHHHDLNMKSAYLHLMADAGISLSVAVSGVLIYVFAVDWLDPALSILISFFIIIITWKVLAESYQQIKKKLF